MTNILISQTVDILLRIALLVVFYHQVKGH